MISYVLVAVLIPVLVALFLRMQSLSQKLRQIEDAVGESWLGETMGDLERISGEVERRLLEAAGSLEVLMSAADERIARLEQLEAAPQRAFDIPAVPASPGTGGGQTIARYAEVIRLAESGLDVGEIARRASVGRGEIDLVLRLRGPVGSD